jgi:uncharacterized protein (DUF1778 family)
MERIVNNMQLQVEIQVRRPELQNAARPRPLQDHLEAPMPRSIKRKHPLSMRLSATDIATIDRAATLLGRSRTEFVREAAVRAAEDALMEARPFRMSPGGFKAFMDAMSKPATAVPEMIDVFQRKAPWEFDESRTAAR